MANLSIQDAPQAGTVNLTDRVPLSQGDGTAKTGTVAQIVALASGGGGGGIPATTVVSETSPGQTPAVGVSTRYARQDHTHGTPGGIIDILYADLLALKQSFSLVPEQRYQITDFATTFVYDTGIGDVFNYTGEIEPLIVTAKDVSQIYQEAFSPGFRSDILRYEIESTIKAIDGTTPAFTKGRINYREDTVKRIKCPFDFRNVKTRLWETSLGSGVFAILDNPGDGRASQMFPMFDFDNYSDYIYEIRIDRWDNLFTAVFRAEATKVTAESVGDGMVFLARASDIIIGTCSRVVAHGTVVGLTMNTTSTATFRGSAENVDIGVGCNLYEGGFDGNLRNVMVYPGHYDWAIPITGNHMDEMIGFPDIEALHQKFYNNSGGTLAPGVAVVNTQWNAANSATEVIKARANSNTTCPCHGLVETSTADNAVGEIRTHGVLYNVNTSAWSEGQDLWLSPTTAGALTTTEPVTVGQYKQFIGTVVKQHATTGIIAVQLGPPLLIAASGGAATITQTTVDCGSTGVWAKNFTITDAAVTATSKIMAHVTALATTNNDADEIEMSGVMAVAGTPATGSFSLSLIANDGPISGQFKVNYLIGA